MGDWWRVRWRLRDTSLPCLVCRLVSISFCQCRLYNLNAFRFRYVCICLAEESYCGQARSPYFADSPYFLKESFIRDFRLGKARGYSGRRGHAFNGRQAVVGCIEWVLQQLDICCLQSTECL